MKIWCQNLVEKNQRLKSSIFRLGLVYVMQQHTAQQSKKQYDNQKPITNMSIKDSAVAGTR